MGGNALALAILKTLSYSDHFSFPLQFSELHSRLLGYQCTPALLQAELTKMIRSHQLSFSDGYYYLPSRSTVIQHRLANKRHSQILFKKSAELSAKLARVPGVLAIFLTGALAVANADQGDDIDLLIITQSGKLWTTRLFLTLYTTLLGLRRTPSSRQIAGKLCLNLYLTPASLTLPASRRSIYTAYELIQAVPLHDPLDLHASLLAANAWILAFLPNFAPFRQSAAPPSTPTHSWFEKIAYLLQHKYMQKKITRELITPDSAYFHPHNPGSKILSKLTSL